MSLSEGLQAGPVPSLETERLLLREWRAGDLDAYAALVADPGVMRFLGGETLPR